MDLKCVDLPGVFPFTLFYNFPLPVPILCSVPSACRLLASPDGGAALVSLFSSTPEDGLCWWLTKSAAHVDGCFLRGKAARVFVSLCLVVSSCCHWRTHSVSLPRMLGQRYPFRIFWQYPGRILDVRASEDRQSWLPG